jgi:hypothetical protein
MNKSPTLEKGILSFLLALILYSLNILKLKKYLSKDIPCLFDPFVFGPKPLVDTILFIDEDVPPSKPF